MCEATIGTLFSYNAIMHPRVERFRGHPEPLGYFPYRMAIFQDLLDGSFLELL